MIILGDREAGAGAGAVAGAGARATPRAGVGDGWRKKKVGTKSFGC
jgi:hypothetical protein